MSHRYSQVAVMAEMLIVMVLHIMPDNITANQGEQFDIEIWLGIGLDEQ
jgi:hypothetical protein